MRMNPIRRSAIAMENITLFTLWGIWCQKNWSATAAWLTYIAPKTWVSCNEQAEHAVGQDDEDRHDANQPLDLWLQRRPGIFCPSCLKSPTVHSVAREDDEQDVSPTSHLKRLQGQG